MVNPEAYEKYLQGQYLWRKRTVKSLYGSVEYFQQAVRLDPCWGEGDERAQRAGLEMLRHVRVIGDAGTQVAAQGGVDGGGVSRERHERDVDLGGALDDFDGNVRVGSRTGASDRDFTSLAAGRGNNITERAIGRVVVDENQLRRLRQAADRLKARQRIVGGLAQV